MGSNVMRVKLNHAAAICLVLGPMIQVSAQQKYDLLLKGGHVIDPRNKISAVRDVAIADGKVAAVAANINPAEALKVVDASGHYVTPGLVDIHVHVYAGTGERGSYAGDNSLYPDGFTLRSGSDHGRRRRILGLEDVRGLQGSASSIGPRRACWRFSTSSATACGRERSSRTWPTWKPGRRPRWPFGTRVWSSASRRLTTRAPSGRRSSGRSTPARRRTFQSWWTLAAIARIARWRSW